MNPKGRFELRAITRQQLPYRALRLADPSRPTGRIANVKETIATVRRIA